MITLPVFASQKEAVAFFQSLLSGMYVKGIKVKAVSPFATNLQMDVSVNNQTKDIIFSLVNPVQADVDATTSIDLKHPYFFGSLHLLSWRDSGNGVDTARSYNFLYGGGSNFNYQKRYGIAPVDDEDWNAQDAPLNTIPNVFHNVAFQYIRKQLTCGGIVRESTDILFSGYKIDI